MENSFTHFDSKGNAIMVDVSEKTVTHRVAVASGEIRVGKKVYAAIANGTSAKGDVLGVARIAGVMAAKRTSELIPLCHPLSLTRCAVDFEMDECAHTIRAICTVETDGKTGVEMEALTGVSVTLLTVYDMCKAVDKGMVLGEVRLVSKSGGKSGEYRAEKKERKILAVSGTKDSGKTTLIEKLIPELGARGVRVCVVKHDGHSFSPDVPGTDTRRFLEAGALATAVFDSEKSMTVRLGATDECELMSIFPDADLILLEGFKHSDYPKLEMVVSEPVCRPETVIAYISDLDLKQTDKPVIRRDDVASVLSLILEYAKGDGDNA